MPRNSWICKDCGGSQITCICEEFYLPAGGDDNIAWLGPERELEGRQKQAAKSNPNKDQN